jgi:elongator complex protein 2
MILGLTDRRIQVYTYTTSFSHAFNLEGHEDWIRCLALTTCNNGDLMLASGSQDNFVRLWRISAIKDQLNGHASEDPLAMLDEFEKKLAGEAGSTQISTKAHVLSTGGASYNVTLEALLIGHESGLTNVHWSPTGEQLLSTAADNSMILWTPSGTTTDGIWIPAHRFGAVGGRGLSFYGGLWGPDGNSVFASGWTGGWERWQKSDEGWQPTTGVMGHWGSVPSIAWSPQGEYLLSQR